MNGLYENIINDGIIQGRASGLDSGMYNGLYHDTGNIKPPPIIRNLALFLDSSDMRSGSIPPVIWRDLNVTNDAICTNVLYSSSDRGYVFDGTSYCVSSNTSTIVGIGAIVTVEAVISLATSSKCVVFTVGQTGAGFNYGMILQGNGLYSRNTTNDVALGTAQVTLNQWTHIAIVYNSTGSKGYINGVLVGSNSQTTTNPASNPFYAIGQRASNSTLERFSGKIKMIRVQRTELTDDEVYKNYLSAKANYKL